MALSFYYHLRDLGVRAMTNAGTARDKSHHYDGAQRAYVDAANLLSASSSSLTTTTSNEPEGLGLVLERQRMLGLVRRQASLSMRHHVHQTCKHGCFKMKGVWTDRDYNTAIIKLDEAVEAGEIYYSTLVGWKMTNSSITLRKLQIHACINLGGALEKVQQHEAAIETYERCIDMCRSIESFTFDRRQEIQTMLRIANVMSTKAQTSLEGIDASRIQYNDVMKACRRPTPKGCELSEEMLRWLVQAEKTCFIRQSIGSIWLVVEKEGGKHAAATRIQRWIRVRVMKRMMREARRRIWNRAALTIQCMIRQHYAREAMEWKGKQKRRKKCCRVLSFVF